MELASRSRDCMVCGQRMVHRDLAVTTACAFCGNVKSSFLSCTQDHVVCEDCQERDAWDIILRYCLATTHRSAVRMARELMHHRALEVHGPEHHFLVPAVLLAAYYNVRGEPALKEAQLREAERRARMVPFGFCAFQGTCGAAVGTGIFMSLLTHAAPLSTTEWKLANLATARSLTAVAEAGGPRCCKRTSFISLQAATSFLRARFGVELEAEQDPAICDFSHVNRECVGTACAFHPNAS